MKRIHCFALLLAFLLSCALCEASDKAVLGKWDCLSDDLHGGVHRQTLVLQESDGKLAGTVETEDGVLPILEPSYNRERLTFKMFINSNCTVVFDVKVEGGKIEGTFSCPEVSGTFKGTKLE